MEGEILTLHYHRKINRPATSIYVMNELTWLLRKYFNYSRNIHVGLASCYRSGPHLQAHKCLI